MLTSLSKKINQKNTLRLSLGLLALVIFVPNITHADLVDKFLFNIVTAVFGWLVWISGMLLDYAINNMVVDFGKLYSTGGLGQTIDTLWVTVRDIFNLTFIFGLVFIGLRMIFGSDSNTKKLLVSIMLAALLVNFSLFITKFVIDFSNIAAVQFVNSFPVDGTGKPSISGNYMQLMGLTSILDYSTKAGADFKNLSGGGLTGYIFGMMFLYIITSFVFFAGAFLLIIRFVVLNIYMVLSPIMFIGWVFPSMAKYSSEYWSGFLSRCFVAPAYILMVYISAKVLASFSVTGGGGQNSLSTLWMQTGPANFSQVFPPFVLTAVFLLASVVVAQKMSATGGSAVISMQNKLMGKAKQYGSRAAGGVIAGGGSFAARQTLGRGGNALANNKSWQKWAAGSGVGGAGARAVLRTAQGASNSSFDARNVAGVGKAYGLGGGNDKGYNARKAAADKKRKEREIDFGNSLGTVDTESNEGKEAVRQATNKKVAEARMDSDSEMSKADANFDDKNSAQVAAENAVTANSAEQVRLENELEQAKRAYDVVKQASITKSLDDVKAKSNKLKTDAEKATKEKAQALDQVNGVIKQIGTLAESSVKYANQIQYAKTIKGKTDFWNKIPIIRNNHSFGRRNKQLAEEMTAYYGEHGEKAKVNILETEKAKKDSLDKDRLLKDMQKFMKEKAETEAKTPTPPPTPPPTT